MLANYVYNPFINFVKNLGEIIWVFRNVGHPHTYTSESLEQMVSSHFKIIDRKVIYEGKDSQDFGKVHEVKGNLPLIQKIVLKLNSLLGFRWFVREYAILCTKN
jgi:hypothetical protein